MTWFLSAEAEQAPPEVPEANRLDTLDPPAPFGEVVGAAWRAETVRTDAWGYQTRTRRDVVQPLWDRLDDAARDRITKRIERGAGWARYPALVAAEARAAAAQFAEPWQGLPLDDAAIEAEVQRRRRAELDEAQTILDREGGGLAEFAGIGARAMTDEVSLMFAPFGLSSSPLRFVLSEAALGAAAEGVTGLKEGRVAEEMGEPAPNMAARIASGALLGGAFAGAFVGLERGARAVQLKYSERTAGMARDADPMLHEAAVAEAEGRLREELPPAAPAAGEGPAGAGDGENPASDGPTGAPLQMGDFDFSPAGNASPRANRVGYVFGRLLELGYPPHIAAGLTGNLMQESGVMLNTRAVGDGGNAFGMGQWNGERRRQYLAFARRQGADAADLDTQIAFLHWELQNSEAAAGQRIMGARTAREAAAIASDAFWRPGIPHRANRMGYAQAIMDQYQSGAVPRWQGRMPAPRDDAPVFGTGRGYTGQGQVRVRDDLRLDVTYEVMDAARLRPASAEFQPRDRGRMNSDAWIAQTAADLDPALLGPAPTADRGAPIVGPDDMIESGNGRFAAIVRAYDRFPDRAAAYRGMIEELTGAPIPEGVERPVLIARRQTPLSDGQRRQMTVDAQDSGVAQMTPSELARANARAMTPDALATLRPGAALSDAENAAFTGRVLSRLPASQRNALFDSGGALNAQGARVLRQALFARAWPDDALIELFAELEEAGPLKSLLQALEKAAPDWAALRAAIEAGTVAPEFDISRFVVDAMRMIGMARQLAGQEGRALGDVLAELLNDVDLLEGAVAPLTRALVGKFWSNGRAAPAERIADFLSAYAREATRAANAAGDMLGGVTPGDVLRRLDADRFANLPDIAPPTAPEPPAPAPEPPAGAFDEGAQGDTTWQANTALRDELRAAEAELGDLTVTLADETEWSARDILRDLDEDVTMADLVEFCATRPGGAG